MEKAAQELAHVASFPAYFKIILLPPADMSPGIGTSVTLGKNQTYRGGLNMTSTIGLNQSQVKTHHPEIQ
jgi:hypothetical protein